MIYCDLSSLPVHLAIREQPKTCSYEIFDSIMMALQAVQDGSIEQNSKQAKRYIIMVSHGRSGSTLTCTLINNYSSSPNGL